MNSVEKKYARSRLDSLEERKLAVLKIKFTTPGKDLTPVQRAALVHAKKIPLKPFKALHNYTRLDDIFDFSAHESPEKIDKAAFTKASERVQKEAATVRDLIMLGDPAEALDALNKFAKDS